MPFAHQIRHFLKEEGHQQRGDMRAVDIGIGHDDDPLIPQIVGIAFVAHPAAEREREIGDFGICADFVHRGTGDIQDLAADRQDRLRLPVPRLLGGATGTVALDNIKFSAFRCQSFAQSVSLPGRRSLRADVAVLRLTSRSALRASRSSMRSMT